MIDRIKAKKNPAKEVLMVISPKGIAMLDNKTTKLEKVTTIDEVSYVSQDAKDKKIWSFIANNEELGIMTCYNYKARKLAADIASDINEAFLIVSGKMALPNRDAPRRRLSMEEASQVAKRAPRGGSIRRGRQGSTNSRGSGTSADSDEIAQKVVGTHEAKYIASVAAASSKGEQTVLDVIDDAFEGGDGGAEVFIMVNGESIKCVNAVSQGIMWQVLIGEVSYSSVVNNIFCFLHESEMTGRVVGHVFAMDEDLVQEVFTTLGKATKVAHDLKKKAGDPFRVKDKDKGKRERVPGQLHKIQCHRS